MEYIGNIFDVFYLFDCFVLFSYISVFLNVEVCFWSYNIKNLFVLYVDMKRFCFVVLENFDFLNRVFFV